MVNIIYSVLSSRTYATEGISLSVHPVSFDTLSRARDVFEEYITENCEGQSESYRKEGYVTDRLWVKRDDDGNEWQVFLTETELLYHEQFPVVELMRDDLRSEGFNADEVSDHDMYSIARRMGKYYQEGDFYTDLVCAANYFGAKDSES